MDEILVIITHSYNTNTWDLSVQVISTPEIRTTLYISVVCPATTVVTWRSVQNWLPLKVDMHGYTSESLIQTLTMVLWVSTIYREFHALFKFSISYILLHYGISCESMDIDLRQLAVE